jgi:UDP-N-acetylglucosamine acyltransferase
VTPADAAPPGAAGAGAPADADHAAYAAEAARGAPEPASRGVRVHPTALVHPRARLGADVEVGPWAIVGDNCEVGDGCVIDARATLERNVRLGRNVRVGSSTILGGDPQDLKFRGEETWVEVGDDTVIREFTHVNRGTTQSYRTTIGRNAFVMSFVHLAHDCHVGDGVILVNNSQLAGHVTVEEKAIVAGLTAVHQFVRIGRHAFVGGCSRVVKDVPPFVKAVGNPVRLFGLNTLGLQRSGFDEATLAELKRAYRLLFRSELPLTAAVQRARAELDLTRPAVRDLLDFVAQSERGVGF